MDNLVCDKFSIIIPAYNEARTIRGVIIEALKVKEVSELIVVDDGSADGTEKAVRKLLGDPRVIFVSHKKNRGKGAALRTGIKKAKNEVVMFLDADLRNITGHKIRKIALPVLSDEVDVSRASFCRRRGRVTEFAVKPMMKILFPGMYFDQPISGQVCAKKSFLEALDLENRWGVDIGILLDAIQAGQRIIEVDIGKLEHKANSSENIAEMSMQVLEMMIKKAGLIQHKYKLVVFTLDNTLIPKDSLLLIFKKLKIDEDMGKLQQDLRENKIAFREFTERVTKLLAGVSQTEIEEICRKIPLAKYALEVIRA